MYDVAQYALHFALHFSGNVMQHQLSFVFANDCRMKHKWLVLLVTAVCFSQVVAQNDRLQRAGRNKDGILKIKREGFFDGEGDDSDEPVGLTAEVIEIVQAPDLSGGPPDGLDENDIEPEYDTQEENVAETTEPQRELTPEEIQGENCCRIFKCY
jgi:hypothetical protein